MNARPILLIEDDADIRDFMRQMLELAKLPVVWAENGAVGLEQLELNDPRLIVLDLRMPVMDGIEFLERIQDRRELVERVVVTSANRDSAKEVARFRVKGVMIKPFDVSELLVMAKAA